MNGWKCLVLSAVAGICLMAGASNAAAQISVNIGVEPSCPYGYYDYAPITVLPTATMAQNGSTEASSSGPAHGFMVRGTSMAKSITVSTSGGAIGVEFQIVAIELTRPIAGLPTAASEEMRCATGAATQATATGADTDSHEDATHKR